MNRRAFLTLTAAAGLIAAFPRIALAAIEKVKLGNDEWKKRLSAAEYEILREEGTESPYTSALLEEKRTGVFACIACDLPLFDSKTKYESGTGWPSFYDHLPGALETKTDYKIVMPRTEYHCARCGGHHGHVFKDGPKPTGLRYCSNGAVLKFIPKA
ncbi:MAG: peptide-methionine (R)-S-oxide reductase MsrB [Pseudomonadota bacterium]